MRLNVNLASQRYEVAQSYRRQMTLVIGGLGILAVLLLSYIFYQRQHSRSIIRQTAAVRWQMHTLENEEAQARAILNKPANRVIADQSDFLNQLFARKSLSWTRVFTEMEKIVPAGLHVISMKPEYTKTNDLVLHVIVATDSRDRAVELVRNMEKSTHLRQAEIVAETVTTSSSDQAAGGGNIQFDIAATYVPGAPDAEESQIAPDKNAAAEKSPAPVNKPTGRPMNDPAARGRMAAAPNMPPNVNAAQSRPMPQEPRGR